MEISVSLKTEHMFTDLHMSNTIKVTCMLAVTICSRKTEDKAQHNCFAHHKVMVNCPNFIWTFCASAAPDYKNTHSFFAATVTN